MVSGRNLALKFLRCFSGWQSVSWTDLYLFIFCVWKGEMELFLYIFLLIISAYFMIKQRTINSNKSFFIFYFVTFAAMSATVRLNLDYDFVSYKNALIHKSYSFAGANCLVGPKIYVFSFTVRLLDFCFIRFVNRINSL